MSADPIREGCAIYIGLFVWGASVIVAINVWGVPDSSWVALAVFGPLAVGWIAVWIARRTDNTANDE